MDTRVDVDKAMALYVKLLNVQHVFQAACDMDHRPAMKRCREKVNDISEELKELLGEKCCNDDAELMLDLMKVMDEQW